MKNRVYEKIKNLKISIKKNFNIKKIANFKIGGNVKFLITVKTLNELLKILKILKENRIKCIIIGNLTNVLIKEGNLNIAMIKLKGEFENIFIKNKSIFYAGAGTKIKDLITFCVDNRIKDFEFLAGIPGTIGGAVFMNAGAFGKGIGDYIKKIYTITPNFEYKIFNNNGKIFKYRESIFQKDNHIILGVDFLYKRGNRSQIIKSINRILEIRKEKHPWQFPSAGSFFKNTKNYSAGKLIEMAGLKGKILGGAKVSEKHANFIINTGKATFKDVIDLSRYIKKEVYKKFKIKLQEEVRIIK